MKIAIAGCLGRMGRTLLNEAITIPEIQLCAVSVQNKEEVAQAAALLASLGQAQVAVVRQVEDLVLGADAVIDFTTPEYTLEIARHVAAQHSIHIIGTTGFDAAQYVTLAAYAKQARIVQSGNFSIGVNVVEQLVEQAAKQLAAAEYDIEILEMHHRHKVDAPSGTALLLADAAAKGRGVALEQARSHYAEGRIGEREQGSIGISVQRGGEVVGEHTVTFAGNHETITISHRSFSRAIYAQGALQAALWASDKPNGLYSMRNVVAG